eukprot:TRINITY_DN15040_c0_g1_i3.p1 TRINITY_DN15040_c0_g1~~TRINITY_DN15040_c0_g1_i3.p1  ORF type:complete len:556 (-),score=147.40 TRINITY_DN15040_c0_g1_i3:59-1726(-)
MGKSKKKEDKKVAQLESAMAAARSSANAASASSARVEALRASLRGPALEVLEKLEAQVENLENLAEEYLDQGLIGCHVEACTMRDNAKKTLEETRKKFGIASPPEPERPSRSSATRAPEMLPADAGAAKAAAPSAPAKSAAPAASGEAAANGGAAAEAALGALINHPDAMVRAAARMAAEQASGAAQGESSAPVAAARAEEIDDDLWFRMLGDSCTSTSSASGSRPPRYQWRQTPASSGAGALLRVAVPRAAEDEADRPLDVDVDVSERAVLLTWRQAACGSLLHRLRLPLFFCTDAAATRVVRRKRDGGILELTFPFVSDVPTAGADDLVAGLASSEGHGVWDGFMAGRDADDVRERLAALWRAGEFRPGEVEGKDQPRGDDVRRAPRSDKYTYTEDGDPVLVAFTRRLDNLVLRFCKEVPALRGKKLIRGRPMAAVYSGEGSRYTPHFDCVGGDNGRLITCILYLNPFWREGDGAELNLWPEATTLAPRGCRRVVQPLHGRLAAFLCDSRNLHEVTPVAAGAHVEPRMAISCWYYDSDAIGRVAEEQKAADAP